LLIIAFRRLIVSYFRLVLDCSSNPCFPLELALLRAKTYYTRGLPYLPLPNVVKVHIGLALGGGAFGFRMLDLFGTWSLKMRWRRESIERRPCRRIRRGRATSLIVPMSVMRGEQRSLCRSYCHQLSLGITKQHGVSTAKRLALLQAANASTHLWPSIHSYAYESLRNSVWLEYVL